LAKQIRKRDGSLAVQDLAEQGLTNERLPDAAKRYIYRPERSRQQRERSALSRRGIDITEQPDGQLRWAGV